MIHKRQNNVNIQKWWANQPQPTWNVVIRWFRLLGSKIRVPISSCRNDMDCVVSLLGEDDVQRTQGDASGRRFAYRHFYVEVQFQGHSAVSSVEIIIRKELIDYSERWSEFRENNPILASVKRKPLRPPSIDPLRDGDELGILPRNALLHPVPRARSPVHDVDEKYPVHIPTHEQNIILDEVDSEEPDVVDHDGDHDYDDETYDFWDDDLLMSNSSGPLFPDEEGSEPTTYDHVADFISRVGVGGLIGILIGVSIGLALLFYGCWYCNTLIQRRFGRSRTIKLRAKNRSILERMRSFGQRLSRGRRSQPMPSFGRSQSKRRRRRRKRKQLTSSSLTSDAPDDEEIFPNDRSSMLAGSRIGRSTMSTLDDIKRRSTIVAEQANEAFSAARRSTHTLTKKTKGCFHLVWEFFFKCFRGIWRLLVRCCVGRRKQKRDDNYRLLPDSSDEESSDDDYSLLSHIVRPSTGNPKPSTFVPKTDISGRFIILSQPEGNKTLDKRSDEVDITPPVHHFCHESKQVGINIIPSQVHSPRRKCGLHCIQRHPVDIERHSDTTNTEKSERSSIASGDGRSEQSEKSEKSKRSERIERSERSERSESTSVTSSGSDVPRPDLSRDLSVGDAPVTTECPPLPNVLCRTKQGFRRENQRMEALMKRWERRASSCVIIDETSRREREAGKKFVTIGKSRRSASVGGRFLNIDQPNSRAICPPRLLHRRSRMSIPSPSSNSIQEQYSRRRNIKYRTRITIGSAKPSTSRQPVSPPSSSKSPSQCVSPAQTYSTPPSQSYGTPSSIHTSEIDEIISDGNVSISTNKIEVTSSSDDNNNSLRTQKTFTTSNSTSSKRHQIPRETTESDSSAANDVIRPSASQPSKSTSKPSASSFLQSAAQAFLTSDDDFLSNDEDMYSDFWKRRRK